MIRFFRHLRQRLLANDKFSKYLLYAFGEIVLVMIGILLALQVNNWNEDRKAKLAQTELLKGVMESLKADSTSFVGAQNSLESIQKLHQDLYQYSLGKIEADEIWNLHLIRRSSALTPVTRVNYPDLANQIKDEELKKAVLRYYQIMDLMAFNEDNFNAIVEDQVRTFLAEKKLLNFAYQGDQNEPWKVIHLDRFVEEMKNEDLMQLIFNVKVKVDLFHSQIGNALEQYQVLKPLINRLIED